MKRQDGPAFPVKALAVSAGVSLVLLVLLAATGPRMDLGRIATRLLWPLLRLVALIGLGLVAGQIIEASGWTRHLAAAFRPAFRFGRLGDHCGAAFTTAFFSGTAANAMLLEFYRQGRICRRQLFLVNLLNQFPAYFLHLPTTVFIVVPLTGRAGGIYFLLTFAALVLRCTALLVFGRFFPPDAGCDLSPASPEEPEKEKRPRRGVWAGVRSKLPGRLAAVVVYVVPIYIFIFLLNALGLFAAAEHWLTDTLVSTLVPVESLSIVILGFVAEFTSGFAAAGALMEAGVLSIKETALALLIGNIIAFPIRALRHQLPRYMGIFAPRLGAALLLTGQGYRIASLVLVAVLYAIFG